MRKMFLAAIVIGLVGLSGSAAAQDTSPSADITVFPALIELNSKPGQTSTTNLVIVNNSELPLPVTLSTESLIPADQVIDLSKRSQFDSSRWITLSAYNIALEPGQTKTITATTKVPPEASPGGHYAEILVKKLVLPTSSQPGDTVLAPQVKVPVLITLEGKVTTDLIIEPKNSFGAIISKYSSQSTTLALANTGTSHVLPTATIKLSKNGIVSQQIDYAPGIILPNTKKTFTINWQPIVAIGLYDVDLSVSYGSDGKTSQLPTEKTLVFWPFWLLLLIFGSLALVTYMITKRKNIKAAIKMLASPSI